MKDFLAKLPPFLATISKAFLIALKEQLQEVVQVLQTFVRFLGRLLRRLAKQLWGIYYRFETQILEVIFDVGDIVVVLRYIFLLLGIGIALVYFKQWILTITYLLVLSIAAFRFYRFDRTTFAQETEYHEQFRNTVIRLLRWPFRIVASAVLFYASWQFFGSHALNALWLHRPASEASKVNETQKMDEVQRIAKFSVTPETSKAEENKYQADNSIGDSTSEQSPQNIIPSPSNDTSIASNLPSITDTITSVENGNSGEINPSNETSPASNQPSPTYTLTYDGNGNTGGIVPSSRISYEMGANVIVPGNTGGLTKPGFAFAWWNTSSDGTGTSLTPGSSFTIDDDFTLFAQWTTYRLEYVSGNRQSYIGGGMPYPMVFKIKNTLANEYINTPLSSLNLSMTASASRGFQDAEFNNFNNYNNQGSRAFGGYYYVEANRGAPYILRITERLYLNGLLIDSYLITQNIRGNRPTRWR